MKAKIVIPARYDSTRLPGKPLVLIDGIPMIQRVWAQSCKVLGVDEVIVATDHEGILHCILDEGGQAVMTSPDHISGSDRIAEVARDWDDDTLVLNVQGDLPYVDPNVCSQLLEHLKSFHKADITTPVIGSTSLKDFENPSIVKAIFDLNFKALYFTRHGESKMIDNERVLGPTWYRHIGIYAYRNRALQQLARSAATMLEKQETLEQLRAIEYGYHIKVVPVINDCGPDINCPEDLDYLKQEKTDG